MFKYRSLGGDSRLNKNCPHRVRYLNTRTLVGAVWGDFSGTGLEGRKSMAKSFRVEILPLHPDHSLSLLQFPVPLACLLLTAMVPHHDGTVSSNKLFFFPISCVGYGIYLFTATEK